MVRPDPFSGRDQVTDAFRWLSLAALAAAVPVTARAEEESSNAKGEGWHLLDLASRRRVFFKYEKRIRDLSPPDKVFDYFASVTQDGNRYMTPADLLNSLIAVYPPEGTNVERSGALRGDRRVQSPQLPDTIKKNDFFKMFDEDGDGLISFSEYLMIVTFLAIPLEELWAFILSTASADEEVSVRCHQDVDNIFSMFDEDNNGEISLEEFRRVTTALRHRLRRVSHLQRTGLHTNSADEAQGLLLSFFGPKGEKPLDLKHFAAFCTDLHAELVRLEFLHYDVEGDGHIPGISFAHSLVSHAKMQSVDACLTRIDKLPDALKTCKVTWEDFKQFAQLRRCVHKLAVALDFFYTTDGRIGRRDFQRAVVKIMGKPLPEHLVDIIFAVYDPGQKDDLAYRELLHALQKREGNMIYSKQMLELDSSAEGQGVLACLRSCLFQS